MDEEDPDAEGGAESPAVSAVDAREGGEYAAAAIVAAKRNAETLETAILRRAARRAVRNEKRHRARKQCVPGPQYLVMALQGRFGAAKKWGTKYHRKRDACRQEEALSRLQQRRAHWQQVQQMSAAHSGQQHGHLGRYLGIAHRITNLQLSLECVLCTPP